MRHFYYNRQGQPVSSAEVEKAWRDRRVAYTDLGRLGRVSTVFLGIDHAFEGPPLIFETLVFDGPLAEEMVRYTTEDQARTGHEFMILRLTVLRDEPEPKRPALIHNGGRPRKNG